MVTDVEVPGSQRRWIFAERTKSLEQLLVSVVETFVCTLHMHIHEVLRPMALDNREYSLRYSDEYPNEYSSTR